MSSGADRFVPAALATFASAPAVAVVASPFTVVVCAGACVPGVALAPAGCVFVALFVTGADAGADVGAGAGAGAVLF